ERAHLRARVVPDALRPLPARAFGPLLLAEPGRFLRALLRHAAQRRVAVERLPALPVRRIRLQDPGRVPDRVLERVRRSDGGIRALYERSGSRTPVRRRREPGPRLLQPLHRGPDGPLLGMALHRFAFKAMGCPCALQLHAHTAREAGAWAARARAEIERL